ncbi:hypothetical protein [Bacillus sp. AK031]
MVLFSYLILNILVIFLYSKTKKNLHILEVIVYWLFSSYLFQNLSALCYMNLKTFLIPEKLGHELAHFVNRTVLYPALMVTFLHFFLPVRNLKKKLLIMGCFTGILCGMEWIEHLSGVVVHVDWQPWWSIAYWISALLLLVLAMRTFRKVLYKGG